MPYAHGGLKNSPTLSPRQGRSWPLQVARGCRSWDVQLRCTTNELFALHWILTALVRAGANEERLLPSASGSPPKSPAVSGSASGASPMSVTPGGVRIRSGLLSPKRQSETSAFSAFTSPMRSGVDRPHPPASPPPVLLVALQPVLCGKMW